MAITPESILFGSQFFRWCQDNGETIVIQHETVLIEEGRITPNLYLMLEGSGQVRTTRESEDEGTSSIELAVIGAGQFVGEMSLLEDRLPVATVIALPDSRWIRVNYKRLVSAMAKDKQLAVSTYQVFAEKLSLQLSKQNAFIHRWPGEDIEPLRKVLLVFGEWNELDVAWLAQKGERMELEQQTTFIHEGETLEKIFVVLDGEADVLINIANKSTKVGSSRRGEILGEMSFLGENEQATATVQAKEAMLLLAVKKSAIRQKLEDDTGFAVRFYRSLAVLLSHRSRDQLMARGMAAQAASLEELDLSTLSNLSTAGQRFEWLCQEIKSL